MSGDFTDVSHYFRVINDDSTAGYVYPYTFTNGSGWTSLDFGGTKPAATPKEGVEMKGLFEVYLVYGEDRKEPIVHAARVIAASEEDAKIKSGLMPIIKPEWDADYLTFIVRKIGDVAVKARPSEVKQV